MSDSTALAHFGGLLATGLIETVDLAAHPEVLESGWWAVAATFEGTATGYRFADVRRAPLPGGHGWPGVHSWSTSMDRKAYVAGVQAVRREIAAGRVYQVNLCRLMSADLPSMADPLALAHRLALGNPAPYQGVLVAGSEWVVTASPELFLARDGDRVTSGPIKGTADPGQAFSAKDFPENIMITDLVRNDLGRVAQSGSVRVEALAAAEDHPGLRHLVSTVSAGLRAGVGWKQLWEAVFPPGSVSGAPKYTALQVISDLEPVPRGVYCGAVGFVDGDRRCARLAVGIRTFFTSDGCTRLHFGTGAGITWASDPAAEWAETELKAANLLRLAAGT